MGIFQQILRERLHAEARDQLAAISVLGENAGPTRGMCPCTCGRYVEDGTGRLLMAAVDTMEIVVPLANAVTNVPNSKRDAVRAFRRESELLHARIIDFFHNPSNAVAEAALIETVIRWEIDKDRLTSQIPNSAARQIPPPARTVAANAI